ncbi:transposase [Micromonospora sp. CPCC 206061]|uniref:transposase n=1 Tax=Micromonospora sp. CPCC 206061 TaxID=3122410 RepID=UPI002FF0C190
MHLLAVMDHATGAVLGQVHVAGKTNEITAFRSLRRGLDLTRTVLTADALHTQHEHADWLVHTNNAAYICIVKRNQPGLYRQLEAIPWQQVSAGDDTPAPGAHGRDEIRRLQVEWRRLTRSDADDDRKMGALEDRATNAAGGRTVVRLARRRDHRR